MKKITSLLLAIAIVTAACNNEAKDSVEKADSANRAKLDSPMNTQTVVADPETSSFLVKAADEGMAEVALGQLAQQKATDEKVKEFGAMLVHAHSMTNNEVKNLAAKRNITLPSVPGDDNKKTRDDLDKKTGAAFDKAFMNQIVDDHQSAVSLFESSEGKVNDTEVRNFIINSIPKLKNHLDSAKAIQKRLK